MEMNILITICAREGSKGVRNKNIRLFLGNPLILYSIKFALEFKEEYKKHYSVDIAVSSDSREVRGIVKDIDFINYVERPESLSQDDSAKIPVIRHATDVMEKNFNKEYKFVADLDVTSPLRKKTELNSIITKAIENNSSVIMTAVKSRRNPYFNMVELKKDFVNKIKPSKYYYRQAAPVTYDLSPTIYLFQRDTLICKLKENIFDVNCEIFEIEDRYVIDIDNEMDFVVMESLVKNLYFDEFKDLFVMPIVGE
jgi:CMP-N,N'-diacetyllegionaminic acid synthase